MKRYWPIVVLCTLLLAACNAAPVVPSSSQPPAPPPQSQSQSEPKPQPVLEVPGFNRLSYQGPGTGPEGVKTAYSKELVATMWRLLYQEGDEKPETKLAEAEKIQLQFFSEDGWDAPPCTIEIYPENVVKITEGEAKQNLYKKEGIYAATQKALEENKLNRVNYINLEKMLLDFTSMGKNVFISRGDASLYITPFLGEQENVQKLSALFREGKATMQWRYLADAINLPTHEPDAKIEVRDGYAMGIYTPQGCAYVTDGQGGPKCWFQIPRGFGEQLFKLASNLKLPPKEPQPNSLISKLGIEGIPENAVAVVLNYPDEAMLERLGKLKTLEYHPGEKAVVIPIYQDAQVIVNALEFAEGEEPPYRIGKELFREKKAPDGYAMLLDVIRAEGLPLISVQVSGEGYAGRYLYSYNGKDGNAPVEYILSTPKE